MFSDVICYTVPSHTLPPTDELNETRNNNNITNVEKSLHWLKKSDYISALIFHVFCVCFFYICPMDLLSD